MKITNFESRTELAMISLPGAFIINNESIDISLRARPIRKTFLMYLPLESNNFSMLLCKSLVTQ